MAPYPGVAFGGNGYCDYATDHGGAAEAARLP